MAGDQRNLPVEWLQCLGVAEGGQIIILDYQGFLG